MKVRTQLEASTAAKLDTKIEEYHERYPFVYNVEMVKRYVKGRRHIALMTRSNSAR